MFIFSGGMKVKVMVSLKDYLAIDMSYVVWSIFSMMESFVVAIMLSLRVDFHRGIPQAGEIG